MRTTTDRIRHTVFYEILLLMVATPLVAVIMDKPMGRVGGMSVFLSMSAMGWNYIYNLIFDKILLSKGISLRERGVFIRVLHAVLFEVGLMSVTLPVVMIVLELTFIQAFAMELGFLIGVPVYTFLYNIVYDTVFPIKTATA